MKKNLFGKILCIGVIFLFIGAGIYPTLAKEITNSKSEIEKDFSCQNVINHDSNKLNWLLNKLEDKSNILYSLSKFNPDLSEKCEELSKNIGTLKEIDNDRSICDILENIYFSLKDFMYFLRDIYIDLKAESRIKAFIFNIAAIPFAQIWLLSWVIGYELNCWEDPLR
jgi:hypothetical protein